MREVRNSEQTKDEALPEGSMPAGHRDTVFSGKIDINTNGGDIAQKVFTSIGSVAAQWWVHHSLRILMPETGGRTPYQEIPADVLREHKIYPHFGNRKFRMFEGDVPKVVLEAIATRGYTYLKEEDKFHFEPTGAVSTVRIGPCDIDQVIGKTGEHLFPMPDEKHPTIFEHHMGRGQTSMYDESMADSEGLSDAKCSIDYLKAYDELIRSPTVRNYFTATAGASVDTGPYRRTMSYALEVGLSQEFLNLLHVGFFIHWTSYDSSTSKSDVSRFSSLDHAVFGAVLKKFCGERGEIL